MQRSKIRDLDQIKGLEKKFEIKELMKKDK